VSSVDPPFEPVAPVFKALEPPAALVDADSEVAVVGRTKGYPNSAQIEEAVAIFPDTPTQPALSTHESIVERYSRFVARQLATVSWAVTRLSPMSRMAARKPWLVSILNFLSVSSRFQIEFVRSYFKSRRM
jgi:hypothetical protein